MANYGRNVEFRIHPERGQRNGRYVNSTGAALPMGVPVATDDAAGLDPLERQHIGLVTGATAPIPGKHGILIMQHIGATGLAGQDPNLTTYSDVDTVPDGQSAIIVSGTEVKVVLRNTADRTFLNTRSYTGRTMVAGLGGATPTIAVGDYLTPGTGDDDAGYWAEGTEANGWLIVTAVDEARGELEARFLF